MGAYDITTYDAGTYAGAGTIGLVFGGANMVFGILVYVYLAVCLMYLAKKTNTPNGWMAWVPLLNVYLMCKIAGKAWWWLILCLIPFVQIVAGVMIWMAIAERLGKPSWWGILILVPIVNVVIMGILAFSKAKPGEIRGEPPVGSPPPPSPSI